jgi:hypothetical protein
LCQNRKIAESSVIKDQVDFLGGMK